MSDIDRRSAFALGLITVAFSASTAAAQTSDYTGGYIRDDEVGHFSL